jgi:O-antigen ligase
MEYSHELGLLFSNPIIAIIVVSIITVVIMRWPEFGIALLFSIPIAQGISFNILLFRGIRLDQILLIILSFRLLYLHINQRKYDKWAFNDSLIICVVILVGLVLLQPLLTSDPKLFPFFLQQIEKIIFPLIGVVIISKDANKLKRLLGFLFGILFAFNIAFLLRVFFASDIYQLSKMRELYFMRVPLWASGPVLLIFIPLTYLLYYRNKTIIVLATFAIILGILFLILGQTRGIWISTIVGAVYLLSKLFHIKHIMRLGYIVLVFIITSSLFPKMWENIKLESSKIFLIRYEKTFKDISMESASGSRRNLWINAWDAFLSSPIWGVGHNNATRGGSSNPFAKRLSVHNDILAILSEQGIIGMIIFMYILYRFIMIVRINMKIQRDNEHIYIMNILGLTMFLSSIVVFQISYWGIALVFSAYLQYRMNYFNNVNLSRSLKS